MGRYFVLYIIFDFLKIANVRDFYKLPFLLQIKGLRSTHFIWQNLGVMEKHYY